MAIVKCNDKFAILPIPEMYVVYTATTWSRNMDNIRKYRRKPFNGLH
jgi:hypothetical protein